MNANDCALLDGLGLWPLRGSLNPDDPDRLGKYIVFTAGEVLRNRLDDDVRRHAVTVE